MREGLNEGSIDSRNHWDKAKSIGFIITDFPSYLSEFDISSEYKKSILNAIKILYENKDKILEQKSQLIHSDLGADNFIFKGNKVITIIDFTPEYSHELYSLCQFLYWSYLWENQNYNKNEIEKYFQMYNPNGNKNTETEILYLLLIRAVLYRIIGPLLDIFNKDIKNYDGLKRRFRILSQLLSVLQMG